MVTRGRCAPSATALLAFSGKLCPEHTPFLPLYSPITAINNPHPHPVYTKSLLFILSLLIDILTTARCLLYRH